MTIRTLVPITTFFAALLLAASALASAPWSADSARLLRFDDDTVAGHSELMRGDAAVVAFVDSGGLEPGETLTLWWVVFNHPEHCSDGACGADDFENPMVAASQLWADGAVVAADGTSSYGARLAVGDTARAEFGPGLIDPAGAEVHLVVRSHGPALDGALHEQLNSFGGGCPPNDCANLQYAIHIAQGG